MNKIKIITSILLLVLTAGIALGEQQTEVKMDIPLHSQEYNGIQINFAIVWNGTGEGLQSTYVETGVRNYFMSHQEYSSMPEEYYFTNRINIENNVSEYLKNDFNGHGINITRVAIRDIQFYKKNNPQAEEVSYRNNQRPTIVYIDRSTTIINWNWYLIGAAFVAGCCITAAIIAIFRKRK